MALQVEHPGEVFVMGKAGLKGRDNGRSGLGKAGDGRRADLLPDGLLIGAERADTDAVGLEFDQDVRDKKEKVGEADGIGVERRGGREYSGCVLVGTVEGFGFFGEIIGKMAKEPFLAAGGPFL